VLQFERIKSPEGVAALREAAPDLIVTAAFGQILSGEILALPPLGCVNVHASLLPAYRGAAPIQWAIMRGETQTGVTIMYMNEGLDTGDIISLAAAPIPDDMTGGALYDVLAGLGASLLADTLPAILAGNAPHLPQDEAKASYFPMLNRALSVIDWDKPAREIRNLIRALDPVMGASAQMDGQTVKIWAAGVLEGCATPGLIVRAAAKDGIVVGTGEGLLRIDELQIPGTRRMPARAFLLGRQLPAERFA